jgi:hypothetical protein
VIADSGMQPFVLADSITPMYARLNAASALACTHAPAGRTGGLRRGGAALI